MTVRRWLSRRLTRGHAAFSPNAVAQRDEGIIAGGAYGCHGRLLSDAGYCHKLASGRQDPLTKRERQVAEKLAQGMAVKIRFRCRTGLVTENGARPSRQPDGKKLGVGNDVELARRMFDGW